MKNENLNTNFNKQIEELAEKEELEQSLALVDVLKTLLESTKHTLNKIYLILIVSLLSNLLIVGAFLWYESHMSTVVEETTETVTTQTVDGGGF